MYGDVIQISEVQPGDVVESGAIRYEVISIAPNPNAAQGGYVLEVKRVSDGVVSRQHSLYFGKEVTLISRKQKATLQPVKVRRYFAVDDITNATHANIRMTWEAYKAHMGIERRVIDSSFMATCECCGGMIRVSQSCLWVKGHVIHLTNQECVDEQAAVIRQQEIKRTIEARRTYAAVCRKARHAAKVMLGTLAMFPALPPGPMSLDGCELWASGD